MILFINYLYLIISFMVIVYVLIAPLFVIFLYLLKQWLRGGKCKIKHEMNNKFIIITGASSGLGQQTAYELLTQGAKVIYACRNEENAKKAINEVPLEYRSNAVFVPLDLCSFSSIISFAETMKQYPSIDILINNAGAQPVQYKTTKDNLESFVEGNHLGPMLLTLVLLDHFNTTHSRILNVSSMSHYYSDLNENSIDILSVPDRIKEHYFKSNFKLFQLYSSTKLMNIYFTHFLADKLQYKYPHIKAVCLHPGVVDTSFQNFIHEARFWGILFKLVYPLWRYFSKSCIEGAQTHLYLSYLPHEMLCNGAYYADCFVNRISSKAQNPFIRDSIIDWSLNVLKASLGESYITLSNETIY